jgi:hypothetical protein
MGLRKNLGAHQMRCFLCYHEPIESYNKRTKSRKCLIFYYKTNGIISLEKYVNASHVILYKTFEEEVNNSWKGSVEKELIKTHPKISRSSILIYLLSKTFINKAMLHNNNFWRILIYLLSKTTTVESV